MAAALLDEAVDLGEAEAGAFAEGLGGEEGFEDAGDDVGGHAGAVVPDGNSDVVAGGTSGSWARSVSSRVALAVSMTTRQGGVGRCVGGRAPGQDGVAGVDGEVQEGVFELVGVGVGGPEAAGEDGFDVDEVAEGAAEEVCGAGDELVEVDGSGEEGLAAGEGEEAGGEGGGAGGAVEGVVEEALGAVIDGAAAEEVEAADDDGEEVVEVVGDASGELADGFHLLGLAELFLGGFAGGGFVAQGLVGGFEFGGAGGDLGFEAFGGAGFGFAGADDLVDVDAGGDAAGDGAGRVADGGGHEADPEVGAVAALVAALELGVWFALEDAGEGVFVAGDPGAGGVVGDPLPVFGVVGAVADGVAEDPGDVGVAGDDTAVGAGDDEADGARFR